jgi:ubiquinone/menaquinone biosynthesis C-methylase UbiE
MTTSLDLDYKGVHKIYDKCTNKYKNYHGGYLNFGYWENTKNYIEAAELLLSKLANMLEIDNKSNLLDVACGLGAEVIYIYNNFKSKIEAVDVIQNHVRITNERIKESNLENKIKCHHATATQLPFDNNTFSHVLSVEAGVHFNTREAFFKEAHRVLKKGGKLVLADLCVISSIKNIIEKIIIKLAQKYWAVPNSNVYNIETYKNKLEQAGFENITIDCIGKYTIPGYRKDKLRNIKKHRKVRGWFHSYKGIILKDNFVNLAFDKGVIEYLLVYAEKN